MAKLHYVVSGNKQGPWLTLGHSLATDSRMWDPQLPALEADFRLLRYDAPGHGDSSLAGFEAHMDNLVGAVIELWDELGIDRSHYLGLSMGGMTGIGLALDHPERVASLIACDCRLDAPDFFHAMWQQRIDIAHRDGMEGLVDAIIATWLTEVHRAQGSEMETRVRRFILETPVESYVTCARAIQTLDYKSSLGEVTIPVLYLVGEQDGPHPAEMRELKEVTAGAQLVTLAGAAHLSNLEQPEAFNRAVVSFLAEHRNAL